MPAEITRFRETAAPLENWLGKRLVIFDDGLQNFSEYPFLVIYPPTREFTEASITPDAIYISLSQLRNFPSAAALADFLSHAAAHAKLNHPAKFQEQAAMERILRDSPHVPEKYPDTLHERIRKEFEAEAATVAREFRAASNCTEQSCELFTRLLAAAKPQGA
jgi:hypothetical protein